MKAQASLQDITEKQVKGLSTLLHISREARKAKRIEELFFLAANETHHLFPYDEALFWLDNQWGKAEIRSVSGIGSFDKNTPKIVWFNRLLSYLEKQQDRTDKSGEPLALSVSDVPEKFQGEWKEFSSEYVLYIPVDIPKTRDRGGMIFLRSLPWKDNEKQLAQQVMEIYAYSFAFQTLKPIHSIFSRFFRRYLLLLTLIGTCLVMSLPMRVTVIAPAEIVSKSPWIVASPHEGVVEQIHVVPNQRVSKGDLLVSLDSTKLENEEAVAMQNLVLKQSELRQIQQLSMQDDAKRGEARLLELEVRQRQNELEYVQMLLEQTNIYSDVDGIAIFSDPEAWEGVPVQVGEKIILVASEDDVEIKIDLPVGDAIEFEEQSEVDLFLYTRPLDPVHARIRSISYQAEEVPGNQLAYDVRADIAEDYPVDEYPRIGLKGDAKLYGEKATVFYNIFRKPISYIKRKLPF